MSVSDNENLSSNDEKYAIRLPHVCSPWEQNEIEGKTDKKESKFLLSLIFQNIRGRQPKRFQKNYDK